MSEQWDAIIVGAGPAGAMAATLLGRAGCRVLLLEQHRLPRYKPCAGGIAWSVLASLPPICREAVQRVVTRARFRLGGEEVCHELPEGSVALISRERLDYLLLSQAPVAVHDGERALWVEDGPANASVTTSRGAHYRADYVVGADGVFSTVGRAAGLRSKEHYGPALEAKVRLPPGLMDRYADACLFLLGVLRQGYAWLFPKSDHVSLGIGSLAAGRASLRPRLAAVARDLGLPSESVRPRGHGLPLYRLRGPLQKGRILLTGDAAGLVDPLSGEGIRHALHSGRLAAEAILGGHVEHYTAQVRQEIGRHLLGASVLARLFYGSQRLWFGLGARSPAVVSGLLRVFTGDLTYGELIARVPGYVLCKLWQR